MIIAILALALAVILFVLFLLVLIGARREAPLTVLDDIPPTPLAGFARAVQGVYVRKVANAEQVTALVKGRR